MYKVFFVLASSLAMLALSACSDQKTSGRCSFNAGDDTGGTLICRSDEGSTTIVTQGGDDESSSPSALVTSWADNGPAGGKAYRSKFRAAIGGHYTTSLDLADLARVFALSIAVHPVDEAAEFTAVVIQASNTTGDVDLVSTSTELTDGAIVLPGPFDVDRFTYNYRLDLNVGPGGAGDLDILSPPLVRYAKP